MNVPHAPEGQQPILPLAERGVPIVRVGVYGAEIAALMRSPQSLATRVTSGDLKSIVRFVSVNLERDVRPIATASKEPPLIGGEIAHVGVGFCLVHFVHIRGEFVPCGRRGNARFV